MAVRIETPEGEEALTELLQFHDHVYEYRSACHLEFLPLTLPILTGESSFARGRELRPFLARDGGEIVARVVAAVDGRYHELWPERLGHLLLFEAVPGGGEATRLVMNAACEWLRERGMEAARAGMGMLELPFVIDDYESLPPLGVRQNPSYYHAFLKDAGFESEKGWVDYRIRVTPELVARYESSVEGARRAGVRIVPLREIASDRRRKEFTATYNETFRGHWGYSPFSEEDLSLLLEFQAPLGALDTSLVAYLGGEPVGVL
ncbi:MAG: hypothetical protein ACREQY_19745, partial [Candidatus Binatia bacterium]